MKSDSNLEIWKCDPDLLEQPEEVRVPPIDVPHWHVVHAPGSFILNSQLIDLKITNCHQIVFVLIVPFPFYYVSLPLVEYLHADDGHGRPDPPRAPELRQRHVGARWRQQQLGGRIVVHHL